MQPPRGIQKRILLSLIFLYFIVIFVSATASGAVPATTSPVRDPLPINSSEISWMNTSPDITTFSASKSPVFPRQRNNKHHAPLNPDFIVYQQNIAINGEMVLQSPLPGSETNHHHLGFIPPTVDLSYTKGQDVTESVDINPSRGSSPISAGEFPLSFDLRTLSKVTPVRDQGTAGSCWAFATYASLESSLLPEESWDFSENNMKNLLGRDGDYPEGFDYYQYLGGNYYMSLAYLARWTGPINESDDPYIDYSVTSPTNIPAKKHVQNVMFLPARANATDNDNIKSALTTYGVVYSAMYYSDLYFNDSTDAYHYPYSFSSQNHGVAIVGWNDNYSRNNFTNVPPADGAFIIKNSWGPDFGDQGFFHISYYDTRVAEYNAVFTAESAQNYDTVYQYDPLGWVSNFGTNSTTGWGANIFRSNLSETLSAVSFYATDENTSYDLYIYKNPDNGPVNASGYAYRENGIISGPPGYYTKVISPGVALQPNDTFSVVMNFTTLNTQYPIPVEYNITGYSSKATARPGQSFYSADGGSTWQDMTVVDPSENICIKAFTISTPPTAAFTANITSGKAPLTVEFTDKSTGFPTLWNWSFGDGVYETMQNPVHTYIHSGAYTVTLQVTNAKANDTLTRLDYIIVNGYKIGIFRNSTGDWKMDYNNSGVVDAAMHFGIHGDTPITGDWNGDGVTDIGVFRPSAWQFIFNTAPVTRTTFGMGSDIPLTGDWNGDGVTDIGVFRPSARQFIFNTVPVTRVTFGLNTDIPITGDWNGDGVTDIGVFRPSIRQFILDFNNDATVDKRITFGLSTDIPVTGKWT